MHTETNTISLFSNNVEIAEDEILKLADFVYTHTNIKPMSKVIYLISRLLLIDKDVETTQEAIAEYNKIARELSIEEHGADYSFSNILISANNDFPNIFKTISRIKELTQGRDSLGIVFDTLLRGKYESGEGLGTFLTPEEVVSPSVDLCLHFMNGSKTIGNAGDLCGGTGRFIHELHKKTNGKVFKRYIIADQSAFSVELARINFYVESVENADFHFVSDTITDVKLLKLNSSFSLIMTNSPFGANKYHWTPKIKSTFKPDFLYRIGFADGSATIDPAEIFVYRNLLFLMEDGILGIVLPDGVATGNRLETGLKAFEELYTCSILKLATISLPASTFALGGTVAKTSFIILKKAATDVKQNGTYKCLINHIGFLKKGNRRVLDPLGNDYKNIAQQIVSGKLKSISDNHKDRIQKGAKPLSDFVSLKREYPQNGYKANYHLSILDVDETGYIEFRTVLSNSPTTKPMLCLPGDILVSCINPKIWRVAIVPEIKGTWSCSAEFAVLRPKNKADLTMLFLTLLSEESNNQAMLLAKGTSSSRQRIQKEALLSLYIKPVVIAPEIGKAIQNRKNVYEARLAELRLFFGDSATEHKPVLNISGL